MLHPVWCYLFMITWVEQIGIIQGAGYALVVSQLINVCLGSFYIYIIKPLPESIFCFSKLSFIGWGNYMKISVPAAFLTCAEWWAFEVLSLVVSTISEEDFTIHIFVLNLGLICFTIPIGFGLSTAILVGREFGKGNVKCAIKNLKLILFFGIAFDFLIVLLIFFIKNFLFKKLIGDEDLADKAKSVLILYDMTLIFDLIQYIFSSFFRGIGKQGYASGITFFNYYIFQLCLAIYFTKVMDLRVVGIWLAIFLGSVFSSVIYLILFLRLDLNEILQETQLRLTEDEKLIEEDKEFNENEEKNENQ